MQGNLTALLITAIIVLTVVCIGFLAGRDKSSRTSVEEWSVGGRRFGGLLVWFLVGDKVGQHRIRNGEKCNTSACKSSTGQP